VSSRRNQRLSSSPCWECAVPLAWSRVSNHAAVHGTSCCTARQSRVGAACGGPLTPLTAPGTDDRVLPWLVALLAE